MGSKKNTDERRKNRRFAIHREMRYKLLEGGTIVAYGTGDTIDVGSGGVAFTAGQILTPGAFIELSISWPALLNNNTPMRLVVYGRVLRSHRGSAVCSVDKYEFRTQARVAEPKPAPAHDSIFRRWVDAYRKDAVRTASA